MAVKVNCSICDKFIKNVEPYEFQKLTGKEICEDCGKKVREVYTELDDMVIKAKKNLEETQRKSTRTMDVLLKSVKRYTDELQSFHTTRKAEIDNRMKDILGGNK